MTPAGLYIGACKGLVVCKGLVLDCSHNVLFFLLFDAFRRLNVAEKKWVNPTHLMYLFLLSYSLYAFSTFM